MSNFLDLQARLETYKKSQENEQKLAVVAYAIALQKLLDDHGKVCQQIYTEECKSADFLHGQMCKYFQGTNPLVHSDLVFKQLINKMSAVKIITSTY